ncbi:MAG: pantetheine-phosphate adenylyltransferase [Mycoplasmoidaceae bacterium]|nr:pantetheine-phosphate adenylyltransferase [Mycoplasmoidaceae bacterium]
MKIAMFPGSFNPLHKGHIDVIRRAAQLFDKLYIVVSINVDKEQDDLNKRFLKVKKQIQKLKLKNVEISINKEFTIDFAKKHKCKYLVRSLRDVNDFKYELVLAQANYKLDKNIETIFFLSNPSLVNISSHAIREMNKNIKLLKKTLK